MPPTVSPLPLTAGALPAAPEKSDSILLGRVLSAHGVRGQVKLKSYTADSRRIAAYGPVHTSCGRSLKLMVTSSIRDHVIANIDGISTRNQAEVLAGLQLFISRNALPPTNAEEFYHADLIGLSALLSDGVVVGLVRSLHDFGAGDVIEIVTESGGEMMIPFTRAHVPVINVAEGHITIVPPIEEAPDDAQTTAGMGA